MSREVCPSTDSVRLQLFTAVEQNDRGKLMEVILSSHRDPRFVKNDKGETLLHVASKHGGIDIVCVLVEVYQLCPFEVDRLSFTPCHYAFQHKHLDIIFYFLRLGGYAYISESQPVHVVGPDVLPETFYLHMLSSAAFSRDVVMTRFAYILLNCSRVFLLNIKRNLFLDSIDIIHKIVYPELTRKPVPVDFDFVASCCREDLGLLKLFIDELIKFKLPGNLHQLRSRLASILEVTYRLDRSDIAHYLTERIGISPTRDPSIEKHCVLMVEPLTHNFCFQYFNSPLHVALQCGNVARVREIIAQRASFYHDVISHSTISHGTFLHSACVSGKVELVKMMIEELECNINAQNYHGDTPLHVACEWGWLNIVHCLLDQNECNANTLNKHGHSPLTLAVKHNRMVIFNFLLKHNITLNVTTTDTKETLLHLACCCPSPEFALSIMNDPRYTCELDAVDKYGDTPLFNACRLGNVEIVKELITKQGCTRLFVNYITKETPAHVTCRSNRLEILQLLLTEGVDEPLKDMHINYLGESLLHIACKNDDQPIIDFLIENKICTSLSVDGIVQSPLHIACARGNAMTAKKLLACGICKSSDTDVNGNTVLHYICARELIDSKIMEIFIHDMKSNKMIEMKNTQGHNPLHLIFVNDGIQIFHCLRKHLSIEEMNAALHSVDINYDTPLHIAFQCEGTLTVKYLLHCPELTEGVSIAVCMLNSRGKSPLHILCENLKFGILLLVLRIPNLSSSCISKAISVQTNEGKNLFHLVVHLIPTNPTDVGSLFNTILDLIPETDVVSALDMKNKSNNTPIQSLIVETMAGTEHLPTVLSWLLRNQLSDSSVKEICSITTSDDDTLLHLATERDLFKSVKVLVEEKLCNPTKVNCKGQTPLHNACKWYSHRDITLLLCKYGYSMHTQDNLGCSPTVFLLRQDSLSLLQELMSKGYCNATMPVQSMLTRKHISEYCYIMNESQQKIELPLLHSMVHNECIYDIILPFIAENDNALDMCDTFGNTIMHLNRSHLFVNNLVEFSCCNLNKQNEEGNSPLHIACAKGDKQMAMKLIESEKCRTSLTLKNAYGHTPLYYTSDRQLINCLIINGADPKDVADSRKVNHLTDMFKKARDKHPLKPTVTALVLGNSFAGKTTLIKSITKTYDWEQVNHPSVGQVKQVSERTAGIEISEYKTVSDHNNMPRVLMYDFAGHPEFHSTHSHLLQNLIPLSESSEMSTNNLFMIVIDITAKDKLKQLLYWVKFIANCQFSGMKGKPEVIIIGSHVDKCSNCTHQQIKTSLCQTIEQESELIELVEKPILLNCCEPNKDELQKVEALLRSSAKKLKEHADLDDRCHLIFSFLYNHFPDKPVKFSVLHRMLRKQKQAGNYFPFMRDSLLEHLESMHCMQHILIIRHTVESNDFWILTAKAQSLIFNDVQGKLFAGEEFDVYARIVNVSNVGVMSSAELKKMFPTVDYEMLQQFLVYSELCKKIDDEQVLSLIESGTTKSTENVNKLDTSSNDECHSIAPEASTTSDQSAVIDYLFFPGLIKKTQGVQWKHDGKYSYSSGWSLECTEHNFFNTLFLQVLLLRLTFQFAATSSSDRVLQRRCSLWKNGLFWSLQGVEILVELINQNQDVIVLVRCFEGKELEAIRLRSAVLKEVFNVKAKHCPATKVNEFIICNPALKEDGLLTETIQRVKMSELVSSITRSVQYVEDTLFQYVCINKELLCFEPYAEIRDNLLRSLFDPDEAEKNVPEEIISDLYVEAHVSPRLTDQFKQLVSKLGKPISYQSLRGVFDKYSIFHGRNPKDLNYS